MLFRSGYGGSCFPKDVKAFIHTAAQLGFDAELIKAVDEVNARQKRVLFDKIRDYFADKEGLDGKTLAVWGIAFKANTDDVREAASLELIRAVTAEGMRVRAFDPVAGGNAEKVLSGNPLVEIVNEQYDALKGADCLAVLTEWNQFRNPKFEILKRELKRAVIFDGRNLYSSDFVVSHGIEYFSIGRTPATPKKRDQEFN